MKQKENDPNGKKKDNQVYWQETSKRNTKCFNVSPLQSRENLIVPFIPPPRPPPPRCPSRLQHKSRPYTRQAVACRQVKQISKTLHNWHYSGEFHSYPSGSSQSHHSGPFHLSSPLLIQGHQTVSALPQIKPLRLEICPASHLRDFYFPFGWRWESKQ